MALLLNCPGCGKVLRIGDNLAGKTVVCPNCKSPLPVPAASAPPAAQAHSLAPGRSETLPPPVPPPREPILQLGHTGPVNWAQYSPDGQRIATASFDRTARVWDAATGQVLLTLQGHTGRVRSASYSPDGRRIVSASGDGTTRVWDARSGQEIVQFLVTGQRDWLAVTPEGCFVASKGAEGLVRHSDGQGGLIPKEESLRYQRPDLVQKALAAAEAN